MNKVPFRISPMLATLADAPFSKPNWIYEEKYDGVRILAYKEGPKVSLISRNSIDRTTRYPEIAAAVASLKARTIALDGEVVVFRCAEYFPFPAAAARKRAAEVCRVRCFVREWRRLAKRASVRKA